MTEVQLDINALQRSGTEIARYRVSAGERVVIGHRAGDGAEIVDVPANGSGRSYTVDRGYRDGAGLQAFVKDYFGQAARLDCCPMDGEVLAQLLADTDSEVADDLAAAVWGRR